MSVPFIEEVKRVVEPLTCQDIAWLISEYIDVELFKSPASNDPLPYSNGVLTYENNLYHSAAFNDSDKYAYKLIQRHLQILIHLRAPLDRSYHAPSNIINAYWCINEEFFPDAKNNFTIKIAVMNWIKYQYFSPSQNMFGCIDLEGHLYTLRVLYRTRRADWTPIHYDADEENGIDSFYVDKPEGVQTKFFSDQTKASKSIDHKFRMEAL